MKIVLIAATILLSGCALRDYKERAFVVPPSKSPTVVHVKATATYWWMIFYTTAPVVQIEEIPNPSNSVTAK